MTNTPNSVHKVSLEIIDVKEPCTVPWDEMTGSETARNCGHCRKMVYDLSAMTRQQAEDLVANSPMICVRFFRRADGTVATADCENAWQKAVRHIGRAPGNAGRFARAAVSAMVGLLAIFAVRQTVSAADATPPSTCPSTEPSQPPIMGRVVMGVLPIHVPPAATEPSTQPDGN